jgi:hypothetical protein
MDKISSLGIPIHPKKYPRGTSVKAWGCPRGTPRNIQEVQASKLGDAPEAPLLHRQKSGHLSKHYIFIASCTMRFSWSTFTFAFSFLLFCLLQ